MVSVAIAPAVAASEPRTRSGFASTSQSTPASYLDLQFALPEKRYVGCLACQRDPLLSELQATVLRSDKVRKTAAPTQPNGKKGKKLVEPDTPEQLWEIELDDTVLFPEGGGQPSDTGSLVPLDDSGAPIEAEAARVREVVRRNLDAVHFVTKPFPVGSRVLARVDLDRRADLMSMHTAQHLLSAVFEREHGLDTLSWSLQKFPEPCYIELPRTPTAVEIERVQNRCNQVIAEGRAVQVKMELVSEETGVELNEKAPQDYRDEVGTRAPVQRTVTIEGLDENPCCGTHYPDLSWLRSLFISPYTTPIRGQNCRLYFVAGPRVLHLLSSSHQYARAAASEAGCNPADLADRVHGMVSTLSDLKRREKRMKEELAGHVAKDLWNTAILESTASDDDRMLPIVGCSFREEEATNSLEFLSLVSIDLAARFNALEQPERKYLFVLAAGDTAGSATATPGSVLILGSEDWVAKAGKLTVDKLAGKIKGGGKGRWQGKLTDKWVAGDREKLERVVQEATI
ncbi:putative alanine--tRNA ligase [Sporobolomyces koalae]|uniref:putative alanine--tRNA ligase n=1 Tax=Sporobolomyces koalae TaxID=500713 RepID=UPI00316F2C83